jgi:hypothetical protein
MPFFEIKADPEKVAALSTAIIKLISEEGQQNAQSFVDTLSALLEVTAFCIGISLCPDCRSQTLDQVESRLRVAVEGFASSPHTIEQCLCGRQMTDKMQ